MVFLCVSRCRYTLTLTLFVCSVVQDLSLDASTARSVPDFSGTTLASYRRAKSLDRRVTESSMTPDLLNFKKGWMTKLYEDGLWKKHWFVLTEQSLRYYRDSIAEEASDLDGEIDLSTCYDVTEFPVQRNYGFQIHSKEGLFTLSAMTSGIRRNWIQAIMKSVRPTITPDVTRYVSHLAPPNLHLQTGTRGEQEHRDRSIQWAELSQRRVGELVSGTCRKNVSLKLSVLKPSSLPEEQAKARATLDLTQPTPDVSHTPHTPRVEVQRSCEVISDSAPPPEQRKNRARDRRRDGRSKTFDWAEFHPGQDKVGPSRERAETLDVSSASSPSSLSSSASSPASSTNSPQTSSSLSAPIPGPASIPVPAPSERKLIRQEEEVEEEQTKRGQDRRRRLHPSSSSPASTAVAGTTVPDGQCKPPVEAPQDQGRMEVDNSACVGVASGAQTANQNSNVQVEIEQRWHQVETTPLREEKQVPITGSSAHLSAGDRIPPQELAALLDKEVCGTEGVWRYACTPIGLVLSQQVGLFVLQLGQTQKELVRLQEQNSLLQEQLQDARGREQSAREGYVLQSCVVQPSADGAALTGGLMEDPTARWRSVMVVLGRSVKAEACQLDETALTPSPTPNSTHSTTTNSLTDKSAAGQLSSDSSSSSPHQVPWQRLTKLNQELKTELEAQRRKHDLANQQVTTLRRGYSEAQDVIGHHEAEIEALQAKLASAMAEIVASEQAVARMRSELKLEQGRCREREEEWASNESTLRAQLRDSEERLRDVEASLLEKTQALRLLEHQQALQRDQRKEVQRLQEKLDEVTGRLIATEEAQALREERERKEQRCLEEKHERERQGLARKLAESEEKKREVEEQLQEAREQVETLLRGSGERVVGSEVREEVLHLQQQLSEQTDTVEALRESVRRLEEERDRLTCRCQELVNQIAEADREVGKLQERLKREETDYYSLESSYERVSEEFAKISRVLREKEEEVRQTKEMYEQLVRQKEQDLNEAFVKMAALGTSLEETELRLHASEELLGQVRGAEVEPCEAEQELKAKLAVAEDRIAELEQHLDALRLGYADLRMERCSSQENVLDTLGQGRDVSPSTTSSSLTLARSSSETEVSLAKRQRIRFSNIQCQKYHQSQGVDRFPIDSTSLDLTEEMSEDLMPESSLTGDGDITQDLTQDISTASDSSFQYCSDTEKFMSVIRALESKLQDTEEKLRDITVKMQNQPGRLGNRASLEEGTCAEPDQDVPDAKHHPCLGSLANVGYEEALALVESCRVRVGDILSSQGGDSSAEAQVRALAQIETDLVSAALHMRQAGTSGEVPPASGTGCKSPLEAEESTLKVFARMLAFEGLVLEKMAFTLEDPKSDLTQSLSEINRDAANLKRSHQGCVSVAYTGILARKLMLESTLVEELQEHLSRQASDRSDTVAPAGGSVIAPSIIHNTCMNAELAYSLQILKHTYQGQFEELQRDLLKVNETLHQRDAAVREALGAVNNEKVLQDSSRKLGPDPDATLAEVAPPELAPYATLIEKEEAHVLAEEIVERHLARAMRSSDTDSAPSLQTERTSLITELRRQAKVLHHMSQQVERTHEEGGSSVRSALERGIQALVGNEDAGNVTSSSLCMHEALIQAQVAYVACRLRADHQREVSVCQETSRSMATLVQEHAQNVAAIHQRYQSSLEEERLSFASTMSSLQEENGVLREEAALRLQELHDQREQLAQLEEAFRKETEELKRSHAEELGQVEQGKAASEQDLLERATDAQRKLETLLQEVEGAELRHEEHVCNLEQEFRKRIQELENAHQEEIQKLHDRYSQTIRTLGERFETVEEDLHPPCPEETQEACPMEEGEGAEPELSRDSMSLLKERVQELELQMSSMRDELENKPPEGDVVSLRDKYQRDFDSLKVHHYSSLLPVDVSRGSICRVTLISRVQLAEDLTVPCLSHLDWRSETCERGFAAMEETHQKVVEDLQRQHQREINKLLEERERLLEEETNATIAAIEAMKNAHREELEKTQRSQLSGVSADIEQLRMQYEEELQSIHRELEVLSEQYSQKCLENAHLAQALEAERQALQQCQRENHQLHTHNQVRDRCLALTNHVSRRCFRSVQELNNRLTVEITRMRSCLSGDKVVSPLTQGKDLYELEVLLRIKESEIQYLKQEINSLKDELQSALRDKKYASDKYKDIYTELSIVRAKADCDISKLREKLLAATEALGERDTDGGAVPSGYENPAGLVVALPDGTAAALSDGSRGAQESVSLGKAGTVLLLYWVGTVSVSDIMKSKSNPDFLKKERSAHSRQVRGVRSKVRGVCMGVCSVSEEVPWDS
ncbi:hypothetical protein NFI96_024779 [Prochilodus magdalenae]|nr:hypothetical protein NFI96_024779 [Prochilodus magdalenae]